MASDHEEEQQQPQEGAVFQLECTATTRRRSAGCTAYGFALLNRDTRELVATGCGPVTDDATYTHAAHVAVAKGLQMAVAHGARRLLLSCDSPIVMKQLKSKRGQQPNAVGATEGGAAELSSQQPLAVTRALLAQLAQVEFAKVDRWANGLAIIQAEFATELLKLLASVAATPPSRYGALANSMSQLLQLPLPARRTLEAADDIAAAVAKVVAQRCGTDEAAVRAVIAASGTTTSSSSSPAAEPPSPDPGLQQLVAFSMSRSFTAQEGAAYAAAAAAAAAAEQEGRQGDNDAADDDGQPAAAAAVAADAAGGHRLRHGRLVGRHRMDQRLLVVGLHPLPLPPPQGQGQEVQPPQQPVPATQHAGASSPAADAAAAAASVGSDAASADALSVELASWLPASRAMSSSDAVGLGDARYSLPAVNSDTATHILQFDGASRNNPGRAGYGYVLYDLSSGRLAGRGCMSLPYGRTSGQAEFEGLLAGLAAAREAGVHNLAVQSDSATVLDALMYRRGIAHKDIVPLYHRASLALGQFEHVDLQFIPREHNTLADRLAQMSMDLDTALYTLLRKDERGLDGLRVLARAARIMKKTSGLVDLLEVYPLPLLAVVLLNRVMGITPHQLLERLQAKAISMGDPNPWLVQEVRVLAQSGLTEARIAEVAGDVLDARYKSGSSKAQRRARMQQERQQQQQQGGEGQLPRHAPTGTDAHEQQLPQQQQVRHAHTWSSLPSRGSDWQLQQQLLLLQGQALAWQHSHTAAFEQQQQQRGQCSLAASGARLQALLGGLRHQQRLAPGLPSQAAGHRSAAWSCRSALMGCRVLRLVTRLK